MIETFYSLDEVLKKQDDMALNRYKLYEHVQGYWQKRLELNDKLNRSWKNE